MNGKDKPKTLWTLGLAKHQASSDQLYLLASNGHQGGEFMLSNAKTKTSTSTFIFYGPASECQPNVDGGFFYDSMP